MEIEVQSFLVVSIEPVQVFAVFYRYELFMRYLKDENNRENHENNDL